MYCYVWEYDVKPEGFQEFEKAYGPDGEWVRLFRRDPDYLRTILLRDREVPTRFVTIDFWASREAYEAFLGRAKPELDALDGRCEALTERESRVGDFDIVG